MRALVGRDDRCIADQGVMDARIRDQISLKLIQVHIQGSIKAKTRRDRAHDLSNQTVERLVARTRNVQIPTTNIVDGLIVDQEGAVGVLDRAVS